MKEIIKFVRVVTYSLKDEEGELIEDIAEFDPAACKNKDGRFRKDIDNILQTAIDKVLKGQRVEIEPVKGYY